MSKYPATLGDLADVEARLDAAITRLEQRQVRMFDETEQELGSLRDKIADQAIWVVQAATTIHGLEGRVQALEKLWVVARANPELVRELALQALKGGEG